jgi:rubrerythrin
MFSYDFIDLPLKLLKAMEYELSSKLCYDRLIGMSNEENISLLWLLMNDSEKYYKKFDELYRKTAGSVPVKIEPVISEFDSYLEGIKIAIVSELEKAAFYRSIYLSHINTSVSGTFLEAFTDGDFHAIKLNYLYTKLVESLISDR